MAMEIETRTVTVAHRAYEAVRDYRERMGKELPVWKRSPYTEMTYVEIKRLLSLPKLILSPEKTHAKWVQWCIKDGWVLGDKLDPEKKIHPRLIPFCAQTNEDKMITDIILSVFRHHRKWLYEAMNITEDEIDCPDLFASGSSGISIARVEHINTINQGF